MNTFHSPNDRPDFARASKDGWFNFIYVNSTGPRDEDSFYLENSTWFGTDSESRQLPIPDCYYQKENKTKSIEISVNFVYPCDNPWKVIETAIKEKFPDIEITKLRYTYFESNYGMCELPANLMLANLMEKHGPCEGFNSHIDKCSGTYELKFNGDED